MRKESEKFLTHSKSPEPRADLFAKIMARIHEEERLLSIKKRIIIFSVGLFVSASALIPAITAFQAEFTQSGFYQFLSLFSSDFALVLDNWQDYGLALLESLPITTMIILMSITLIFIWSLKRLAETINPVRNRLRLLNI